MMTRLRKLVFTVAFATLCLANAASAHHGWGGYTSELNAQMTVTEVRWINPHDIVIAKDSSGKEWRLLLAPPLRNRRFGFGPGTIEVGDGVQILLATGDKSAAIQPARLSSMAASASTAGITSRLAIAAETPGFAKIIVAPENRPSPKNTSKT